MCNPPDVIAIVPAAGSSQRMGGAKPKVLLELCGETVLQRTVRTLIAAGSFMRIVVAVREAEIPEVRELLAGFAAVDVIAGGRTRQLSVSHALQYIEAEGLLPSGGLVLVHDAARCLVSPTLVQRCVESARASGAVTAAIPLVDSVKRVGDDLKVQSSVERAGLWAVQTPQVFDFALIRRAHADADPAATDDASLVEKLRSVHVVAGERNNIKITTPEDLLMASGILALERPVG